MSIYRIKMNGRTYEMEIDLIEEGKPKKAESVPAVTKQATPTPVISEEAIEGNPNTTTSPMPGAVIQLMAKAGDEVKENDVILILEAMKMENEIVAPRTGKIKALYVSEGQTVSADAPLFEMED